MITVTGGNYGLSSEFSEATVNIKSGWYINLAPELLSEVSFLVEKLVFKLITSHT